MLLLVFPHCSHITYIVASISIKCNRQKWMDKFPDVEHEKHLLIRNI